MMSARFLITGGAILALGMGSVVQAAALPTPSPTPSPVAHRQPADGAWGTPPTTHLEDLLAEASPSDRDWAALATHNASIRAQPDANPNLSDAARAILVDVAVNDHSAAAEARVAALQAATTPETLAAASLNQLMFVLLALVDAGVPASNSVLEQIRQIMVNAQQADGSFSWSRHVGVLGDTNMTSFAIQALLTGPKTGAVSLALQKAFTYLHQAQTSDGGFPLLTGSAADANSTATVLMALRAAGENLQHWIKGVNPWQWLVARVLPSGHVEYQVGGGEASTSLLTTAQATLGLQGETLLTLAPPAGATVVIPIIVPAVQNQTVAPPVVASAPAPEVASPLPSPSSTPLFSPAPAVTSQPRSVPAKKEVISSPQPVSVATTLPVVQPLATVTSVALPRRVAPWILLVGQGCTALGLVAIGLLLLSFRPR